MPVNSDRTVKRVLEPYDRLSEVLFGLIMVITATGSFSAGKEGRAGLHSMLIGALGCNLAWAVVDAVFYLLACLAERGKKLRIVQAIRETAEPSRERQLIADALPGVFAAVLGKEELTSISQRVKQLPEPPRKVRLQRDDWRGALEVLLLVFLSTFPVVIPFLLMSNPLTALRVSHAIAVLMLFAVGWAFGQVAARHPWIAGLSMVTIGIFLVGLCVWLGG
jgi:VIT1/CCC1 family predicted Fe2+/Mn2+ transporter